MKNEKYKISLKCTFQQYDDPAKQMFRVECFTKILSI